MAGAGAGAAPAAARSATSRSRRASAGVVGGADDATPPAAGPCRRPARLRPAWRRPAPLGGAASIDVAGTSTSANDTGRAPLPRWRPGTCSSSTAWKLVPPKPKALTPARRIPPGGGSHGRSSVLTVNGDRPKSMFGFGCSAWMLGGQHLVVQRHDRLEQAGGAGRALEVADVRLHRAQRDRADGNVVAAEHVGQGLDLDHVADRGRGAVPLDERARRRGHARQLPGPLDGEPLADRVRGGDALAPPVARSGHAEEHGVDAVAVALGVGQPLEQEQRAALAHDEAVGAVARRGGCRWPTARRSCRTSRRWRRPCCGRCRR